MRDNSRPSEALDEALFTVGHIDRTYLISEVPTLVAATGQEHWFGRDRRGSSSFKVMRPIYVPSNARAMAPVTYTFMKEEGGGDTGRALRWVYRGDDGSRAVVYER